MKTSTLRQTAAGLAAVGAALLTAAPAARAQDAPASSAQAAQAARAFDPDGSSDRIYDTPADSIAAIKTAAKALKARDYRVLVNLEDRRLFVVQANDTIMTAPVGVGTGGRLRHYSKLWIFKTPRGVRTVIGKKTDPIWTPPEWEYVEVAKQYGLDVKALPSKGYKLSDGRLLTVRDSVVGLVDSTGAFTPHPIDEHVVYDNILFIPPLESKNRHVEGELGKYALDTGDGYMLHGTPFQDSVGQRSSHGCIRMHDDDIKWLYDNVPVGTKVYIY